MNKKKTKLPPGIRQRTPTTWQIRYYAPDVNGVPERQYETVEGTLSDAKAVRIKRLGEVQDGKHVRQVPLTVRQFLEAFLEGRTSKLAAYTLNRYKTIARLQIYPHIGELKLTKLTNVHLDMLYAKLEKEGSAKGGPLSTTSVAQVHHVIHRALVSAVKSKLVRENCAEKCDEPPEPRKAHVEALSLGDLQKLIAGSKASPTALRFHIPILLGGVLGLRRGETLALRWDDVDFETRKIVVARSLEAIRLPRQGGDDGEGDLPRKPRVRLSYKLPKSGKARAVVAPDFLLEALRQHRVAQAKARLLIGPGYHDNGLVVATPNGEAWNPESFSPRFISAARALGFPGLHYHVLRHTAVSIRLSNGENPKIVQEAMGHHSAGFTMDRYAHVTQSMQAEAADRLDEVFGRNVG